MRNGFSAAGGLTKTSPRPPSGIGSSTFWRCSSVRTPTARTIRVQGAKGSTAVGPFAETKEQLGGFFLIEAKDIDEGCAIAARFPPARAAVIEIRPVQALKHSRDQRGLPS